MAEIEVVVIGQETDTNYTNYNTYMITVEKVVILIDAGMFQESIAKQIKDRNNVISHILLTHCHVDTIAQALVWKKEFPAIKILAHPDDEVILKNNIKALPLAGIQKADDLLTSVDILPEILEINDNLKLQVFKLSGHTPGSVFIKLNDKVFTGDNLYANGLGCISFPESDKRALKQSLTTFFSQIQGDFDIYPAHGPIGDGRRAIQQAMAFGFRDL